MLRGRTGQLVDAVREEGLTFLVEARFDVLRRCLAAADDRAVPGDVVEAGVAAGGSAIVLASLARPRRRFAGFDVFGMIPPPGELDSPDAHARHAIIRERRAEGIAGRPYYGYVDDLHGEVVAAFARHGIAVDGTDVKLVRGLFGETMPAELPERIAFAHLDCDWYDPVLTVLRAVAPRVPPGGSIVLDDYGDYGGCRRAVTDFLADAPGFTLIATTPTAVLRRR
ncbi:TylF/MycF/NovP-related O-methyltransferase [Elioraea sp.]|uniref:TylF/MycF/NovP-related O-methyltransferase n=1 Tax=Elioraea sp. TaxID=2185103 RepID=UPI0025C5C88E|nr:TylF/MycF/NovP-related O-methyltransferase [Elioraea sp.]